MSSFNESQLETIVDLGLVPFTIGLQDGPTNPQTLPDLLSFRLGFDPHTGLIRQCENDEIRRSLTLAYKSGSLLGTAMDDTLAGIGYANDFLDFLQSLTPLHKKTVLEIGAGRGFLLSLLREEGANVLGVEPGRANAPFWAVRDIPIVEAFFPTTKVNSKFNLILGFALLEHIESLEEMLQDVQDHLTSDGLAVFAVPDCQSYIVNGDTGMLLHEHWNYFTTSTLAAVIQNAGFNILSLRPAGYGALLYVAASLGERPQTTTVVQQDIILAREFGARCIRLREAAARYSQKLVESGETLGIYVPGRSLMWIEPSTKVRFFDDDPELWGRYYPPFDAAVERYEQLIANPVDELWIMSNSFGVRIAERLKSEPALAQTRIVLIDELQRRFASES